MNYLQWLVIFFGIPFLLLIVLDGKLIIQYKKIFIKTIIGSLIFSIPWDILSIYSGVWYFPKSTIGLKIINLPIEEFVFIPVATIIMTYITLLLIKKYGISN